MENRAHALIAGLFILLLGAAMVAVIVWFRGGNVERVEHRVVARTGVPGLAVKAPVKLRGVEVGTVEEIAFDPSDAHRILVRIAVDKAAPLTRGTFARLGYQGVTGLTFIDLDDRGDDPRPLAEAPAADATIELQPSLLGQLATSAPELLARFTETANRLNTLLEPRNQQRLAQLLDSAERTASAFGDRARELKPALAALPPLLQRLDTTAQRADTSLQRAEEAAAAATGLVGDLRAKLGALDQVADAAVRVGTATRSIEAGLVGADGPQSPPLLEDFGRAARGVDRALGQWSEQPQSVIFGRAPGRPGPGEVGFDGTAGRTR
jgi:phospholipid/cholesterol/gamma-HCH transport system substrate-binding protein